MFDLIKFKVGERVALKANLKMRGKVVSTKPTAFYTNVCEVIWDGANNVTDFSEHELIAESLVTG